MSSPAATSAAQATGHIVPDIDDSSSFDGLFDEDPSTFTASITSSILAFREENGRTYHSYKEGSYLFPNDEDEKNRLDLQHAVFLRTLGGKLYLAPLRKNVQDVIDIGTGTGLWALDFADEHPSAQVIGTDLSPIQPSSVPPNLRFLVDDAELDWQYRQKFDFIHGRMLTSSLKDWDRFYEQCYKNIKPGGYVEMQDTALPLDCDDDTFPPSSAIYKWSDTVLKACAALERPIDIAKDHKKRMEKAGFVDVVEVRQKWPTNSWAKDPELKEIGRALGWSKEEVETFLPDVRKDIRDRRIHCYWPIYHVYGRKPETAE
ncbi:hypothetical protein AJ80_04937 [Polytolypa hystricis UAMH7299]|uniref:Methyltransferase domain-containing protein n=1 Tax=Polytolypa hystricis (strain UAMH7299) TaxID=1447883 RepID=A0A2B7XZ33_POLH7|nr:hypothetical protein AJ80_04937 [Polytolypa hystricis UAMH7299]